MKPFIAKRQRGAVLLVALVMLLVLTLLAVSGMRGVALESRLTGNRALTNQLQNSAEAALREAEFRFFNPSFLRDKLEPLGANCALANQLRQSGANKPCLMGIQDGQVKAFMLNPAALTDANKTDFLLGISTTGLTWMPYRGRDWQNVTQSERPATWNTYLITGGPADEAPLNVEYGATGEGKGTFFYLVNGQTENRFTLQSTISNVYVGLNN